MATTKKAIAEADQAAEIKEATAAPTTESETPAVTLDELESMDMNMFDTEETESAPRPVWRITDDAAPTGPAEKSQKKRQNSTESPRWAKTRSRRSSRELTPLSADMKTAPVFSPESSRNTSRQFHTRQPRQSTATAFSLALW